MQETNKKKSKELCCEKNCPDYNGMEILHKEQCTCSCHSPAPKSEEICPHGAEDNECPVINCANWKESKEKEGWPKDIEGSHPTKDGWCCACEYDTVLLEKRTQDLKDELVRKGEEKIVLIREDWENKSDYEKVIDIARIQTFEEFIRIIKQRNNERIKCRKSSEKSS